MIVFLRKVHGIIRAGFALPDDKAEGGGCRRLQMKHTTFGSSEEARMQILISNLRVGWYLMGACKRTSAR
jgi:hypothetical protein